jgi:hypothetical protein
MNTDYHDAKNKNLTEKIIKYFIRFTITLVMVF